MHKLDNFYKNCPQFGKDIIKNQRDCIFYETRCILCTYGERHNEFLANNVTKFIQKSFWLELFRFFPNLWIHMHAVQIWHNLQNIQLFVAYTISTLANARIALFSCTSNLQLILNATADGAEWQTKSCLFWKQQQTSETNNLVCKLTNMFHTRMPDSRTCAIVYNVNQVELQYLLILR